MSEDLSDSLPPPGSMPRATPDPSAASSDLPGVIAPPPLIFATAFLAAHLAAEIVEAPLLPSRAARAGGAGLVAAGALLGAAGGITQRRAGTDFIPYRPSTAVVTHGVYAVTRNPMYLGMASVYAGIALLLRSPATLAGLPFAIALINWGVIGREERYLEARFGEPYTTYRERVRRWL